MAESALPSGAQVTVCPVALAQKIVGDRWTVLVLRELFLGSHRFNDIERGLPGISRSLLASPASATTC